MKDDEELVNQVKAALEADVAVSARTLQALEKAAAHGAVARRMRRRAGWGGASALAAASLTAALFFGNVFRGDSAADGLGEVRDAIGLLCAVDGLDEEVTTFPPGEMLLAWQDAPCADLL